MQKIISPTEAASLVDELRALVEATAVEAAAADELCAEATASGDAERDRAAEEADGTLDQELAQEKQRHADAVAVIDQEHADRSTHAQKQYQGRLAEIDAEAQKTRKAAHRNLKEQEWLAESVYEASGQEPS